jgi:hypothetical protein
MRPTPITANEVHATVRSQGVELRDGDIWCVRTGWVQQYLGFDRAAGEAYAAEPASAGLHADEAMARAIWNAHPAALCCDNPAVEWFPGDPAVGSLHQRLLPTLGPALGEMFDFERLAETCRQRREWTFLFVAVPLNLPDGLGSPGNAIAIF